MEEKKWKQILQVDHLKNARQEDYNSKLITPACSSAIGLQALVLWVKSRGLLSFSCGGLGRMDQKN